jgi:hypothetical protein
MSARVEAVWDKGSAAIFDVAVESDCSVATWSIFAPGAGGFGGDRGPAGPTPSQAEPDTWLELATAANQAALYRLLGDQQHMHIDPAVPARPVHPGRSCLASGARARCTPSRPR